MKYLSLGMIIYLVAAAFEAYLAIPIVGGLSIVLNLWMPLVVGFFLHIIALYFGKQDGLSIAPPVLGIAASAFGWIPVVGWFLHLMAFIFYVWHILKGKNGLMTDPIEKNAPVSPRVPHTAPAASASTTEDDLTKIEGVGAKIDGILKASGIRTYSDLASAQVSRIAEILHEHNLASHEPTTWPEQAILARDGKWKELARWQGHPRRRQGTFVGQFKLPESPSVLTNFHFSYTLILLQYTWRKYA